jgi:hypothetical protein
MFIVDRYLMPTDYEKSPTAPAGAQNNAIQTRVLGGTQQ